MRTWMIPWLVPAVIVGLVVFAALVPAVIVIPVIGVLLFVGVPLVWRAYVGEHPERVLPSWLPGSRPPR